MELQTEDGATKLSIATGSTQLLGREAAAAEDPTVSRRHLSLHVPSPASQSGDHTPPHLSLSFQVLGKNPILVVHGGQRCIYRTSEKGELQHGDSFSLSLRNPRFFLVREVERGVMEAVSRRKKRTLQRREEEKRENVMSSVGGGDGGDGVGEIELGIGEIDVSEIDPVKEFGFLVRGHEFDRYPSQRIRSIRDINWFLDDPRVSSDEEEGLDEEVGMRKQGKRVKKRKGKDIDDEVWTGESEDEKASAAVVGTAKKRKYSTRSKDQKKQDKDSSASWKSRQPMVDQDIEEDEEDETLGGFIVNDDEEEVEEEDEEEELEEEDFDEDEED